MEVDVKRETDFWSPGNEYANPKSRYPANVKCEWNLISSKAFSFVLLQKQLASDDRTEPTVKSVDNLKVSIFVVETMVRC